MKEPMIIPLPIAVPLATLPDGGDAEAFGRWPEDYRRWSVQSANKVLDGAVGPKHTRVHIKLNVVYRYPKPENITAESLAPGIEGLKDAGVLDHNCVIDFDPDITYTQKAGLNQRIEATITPLTEGGEE